MLQKCGLIFTLCKLCLKAVIQNFFLIGHIRNAFLLTWQYISFYSRLVSFMSNSPSTTCFMAICNTCSSLFSFLLKKQHFLRGCCCLIGSNSIIMLFYLVDFNIIILFFWCFMDFLLNHHRGNDWLGSGVGRYSSNVIFQFQNRINFMHMRSTLLACNLAMDASTQHPFISVGFISLDFLWGFGAQ